MSPQSVPSGRASLADSIYSETSSPAESSPSGSSLPAPPLPSPSPLVDSTEPSAQAPSPSASSLTPASMPKGSGNKNKLRARNARKTLRDKGRTFTEEGHLIPLPNEVVTEWYASAIPNCLGLFASAEVGAPALEDGAAPRPRALPHPGRRHVGEANGGDGEVVVVAPGSGGDQNDKSPGVESGPAGGIPGDGGEDRAAEAMAAQRALVDTLAGELNTANGELEKQRKQTAIQANVVKVLQEQRKLEESKSESLAKELAVAKQELADKSNFFQAKEVKLLQEQQKLEKSKSENLAKDLATVKEQLADKSTFLQATQRQLIEHGTIVQRYKDIIKDNQACVDAELEAEKTKTREIEAELAKAQEKAKTDLEQRYSLLQELENTRMARDYEQNLKAGLQKKLDDNEREVKKLTSINEIARGHALAQKLTITKLQKTVEDLSTTVQKLQQASAADKTAAEAKLIELQSKHAGEQEEVLAKHENAVVELEVKLSKLQQTSDTDKSVAEEKLATLQSAHDAEIAEMKKTVVNAQLESERIERGMEYLARHTESRTNRAVKEYVDAKQRLEADNSEVKKQMSDLQRKFDIQEASEQKRLTELLEAQQLAADLKESLKAHEEKSSKHDIELENALEIINNLSRAVQARESEITRLKIKPEMSSRQVQTNEIEMAKRQRAQSSDENTVTVSLPAVSLSRFLNFRSSTGFLGTIFSMMCFSLFEMSDFFDSQLRPSKPGNVKVSNNQPSTVACWASLYTLPGCLPDTSSSTDLMLRPSYDVAVYQDPLDIYLRRTAPPVDIPLCLEAGTGSAIPFICTRTVSGGGVQPVSHFNIGSLPLLLVARYFVRSLRSW